MILVVGATGQLGSAVVRKLALEDLPVRAFVRPDSRYDHLTRFDGVEVVYGDLRDPTSVERALDGVSAVVATATAVLPRPGDSLARVDDAGYRSLVDAAERAGVDRFVFVSLPPSPLDDRLAHLGYKRRTERRLRESDLNYTVVRTAPLMEMWLALVGSSVPLRGAQSPTLRRSSRALRLYRGLTGSLVERRGIALVPGSVDTRHAFVAVDDVATFLVRCLDHPLATRATLHFGGPEAVSWDDVTETFGRVLDRPVRAVSIPDLALRVGGLLAGRVSKPTATLLSLNRYAASTDTEPTDPESADAVEAIVDWRLTTVERFLRDRAALPGATRSRLGRQPDLGTGAS
ncbi:SDR family oxidoreductase [Halobium salinum]|uniref:SDR family oxidoreductase n=1 Tax=Halobium salinum TaxID=1364940 RepID=A0ABD5PEL1_9EURY|nr:SDR family oxidoreductase [Halobium salinum]